MCCSVIRSSVSPRDLILRCLKARDRRALKTSPPVRAATAERLGQQYVLLWASSRGHTFKLCSNFGFSLLLLRRVEPDLDGWMAGSSAAEPSRKKHRKEKWSRGGGDIIALWRSAWTDGDKNHQARHDNTPVPISWRWTPPPRAPLINHRCRSFQIV